MYLLERRPEYAALFLLFHALVLWYICIVLVSVLALCGNNIVAQCQ